MQCKKFLPQYGTTKFAKSHLCVEVVPQWLFKSNNENKPIYILDKNPELLAKSLTINHIKTYIEYIVYSVVCKTKDKKYINSVKALEKSRVDYMFSNQRTLYFFCKLYIYMQEMYMKKFGSYYKVCKDFDDTNITDLSIINEIFIGDRILRKGEKERFKGIILCSCSCIYDENIDVFEPYENTLKISKFRNTAARFNSSYVEVFRMMYMLMGYTYDEFPAGPPPWYHCMKQTIYNNYNMYTRLRTRIDTSVDGEYTYYYSVDNGSSWIEVKDIKQMKLIIDSLMYGRDW